MISSTFPCHLRCEHAVDPLGISEPRPRLSWQLDPGSGNIAQAAYRIQVAKDDTFTQLCWDSGDVLSDSQRLRYDGPPLTIQTSYLWRLRVQTTDGLLSPWSSLARFETGFFTIDDWESDWFPYRGDRRRDSANHLRHEFSLPAGKTIARARACIGATCGFHYQDSMRMNLYQLHLNGEKVGRDLYNPGQLSGARRRALYRTYDIGPLVNPGANAVGIVYASARISLQLLVDFTDGTRFSLATGSPGWQWTGAGPFLHLWYRDEESFAYGGRGEVYDAREAFIGWDKPGFDAAGWSLCGELTPDEQPPAPWRGSFIVSPPDILKAQMQSVEVSESLAPASIQTLADGRTIVDFGQDFNGHEQLLLSGRRGDRIVMRFGERLYPDGTLNATTTWGSAKEASTHEDIYTKYSDEPEMYAPTFANHSFRYMEISGLTEPLAPDAIRANVVHSTVLNGSTFHCSDERAQRLHEMCLWSFRSNLMSVPTDCAGRERQGWLSSGALPAAGECANFDMRLFYEKWFDDIADSQTGNGQLPLICPSWPNMSLGVDMLQYALLFTLPWEAYMAYGDHAFLQQLYPTLKRTADFVRRLPLRDGLSHGHAIWNDWMAEPPINGDYLENVCVCWLLRSFARLANELGLTQDAHAASAAADERATAIHHAFFVGDNRYGACNLQSENAFALAANVVPPSYRAQVQASLTRDLEERGHVTTGPFGLLPLLSVLAEIGRNDIVWSLIRSDQPHTMGYWLDPVHKLTAIPEHWSRWDAKFEHANHHDFTSFDVWFFRELVGLKPLLPGYQAIRFDPFVPPNVEHAGATIMSPYGRLEGAWDCAGGSLDMHVTIPPNTTGEIRVPIQDGHALIANPGEILIREPNHIIYKVSSGTHHFRGER